MDVLKGLLLINDIDPFDAYGAFLAEDKPGDMKNYSSLLKPAAVKTQKEVSLRERHGVTVPSTIVQRREARDVSLQFASWPPTGRNSYRVIRPLSRCSRRARRGGLISTFRR